MLSQTLLQTNQRDEAIAWLRWALRQSPALQVDSVNFTPLLVSAFQEARTFVAGDRTEPRASVRFEWATSTTSGGFGDLRATRSGGDTSTALQVSANGEFLDVDRPRRLAPGTYRIVARSAGQADADLTVEVLPGVTTVVTVTVVATVAVDGMSGATERTVLAGLARVDPQQPSGASCKVGAFAAGQGLLLASYQAIRGASALALQLSDGRVAPERVRIAAYSVNAALAVLSVGAPRADSLSVSLALTSGTPLWAAHFPACGDTPALARVSVASATGDSIRLVQDVQGAEQFGVLVTASGALAGVLTGPRSARSLAGATSLLAAARSNLASGTLLTANEVAQREGLLRAPPVVADPSPTRPVGVGQAPKKRSKMLPILGGVALGGIVAVLAKPKGSDGPPPGPTTGGIVIRLP